MNKASGGDGVSAELFEILKDDAVEVPHSVCQQICKKWKQWQTFFSWAPQSLQMVTAAMK